MPTKLKIKVTKKVIEKAKDCGKNDLPVVQNCAIALAVIDIFPRSWVSPVEITNPIRGDLCIMPLPVIAQEFIKKFDHSSPAERLSIQPIEFEISIPDEIVNEINIEEVKQLLVNHPTLELI